jgi:XTP/dITP diphosphohydrolase
MPSGDPANLPPFPNLPLSLKALGELMAVVAQLRSPQGGCPWDLAQTPQTLIPYVIEEAYEVVDALRRQDSEAIVEELGDLLLQVVLQAQIAQEAQDFSLAEVAEGICQKLIRRHPHVFGDEVLDSPEAVRQNWERIKAAEKGEEANPGLTPPLHPKLRRYGQTLPPLTGAMKISRKAAQVGFEWDTIDQVWEKFQEELAEFRQALTEDDPVHQQEELGDLLFTVINLARWYNLDPTEALQGTNDRFIQRFTQVETLAGRSLASLSLAELEALWQQAKARLGQGSGSV